MTSPDLSPAEALAHLAAMVPRLRPDCAAADPNTPVEVVPPTEPLADWDVCDFPEAVPELLVSFLDPDDPLLAGAPNDAARQLAIRFVISASAA
jgi:hypothetical protein